MKDTPASNKIKLSTLAAGITGLVLRQVLYTTGTDSRGLLSDFHWAAVLLWLLTIAVGVMLVIKTRSLSPQPSGDTLSGAGCLILGAAIILSALTGSGDKVLLLSGISRILGIAAGISLLALGISRLCHKQPFWLLLAVVCVYFTFRTVLKYRMWSSHPQLQDYFFYLGGHICLMLASYYHAAAAAEMPNPRLLWIFSLGAVFFCCAAIPQSADPLFLLACGIWAYTGLSCQAPRHKAPALEGKI